MDEFHSRKNANNARINASSEDIRASFRYRTFHCPYCRTDITVTKAEVGTVVVCPDCDKETVVPDYLDFDTETDYERQYYNEEKKERDELYSPLRNPNRVGIDESDVYAARDPDDDSPNRLDDEEYCPVRCRICDLYMQVPISMLGQKVKCPDCGTETQVTDSLKRQQDATNVRFQPRDRGVYEIGSAPKQPKVAVQRIDGKTLLLDPNQKTIAPASPERPSAELLNNPEFFRPIPSIDFQTLDSKKQASLRAELLAAQRKPNKFVRFFEKMEERSQKKILEREDVSKYLPPLVLRYKNGELVWSWPSPPKKTPLLNKTFQAACCDEPWSRGAAVAIVTLIFGLLLVWRNSVPVVEYGNYAVAMDNLFAMFATVLLVFGGIFLSALVGFFFWSIFSTGYSGASRTVEWRSDDIFGYFGYGLWFVAIWSFPLAIPAIAFHFFIPETSLPFLKSVLYNGFFWTVFPVIWLSTHNSGWLFCPICGEIFRSFFTKSLEWIQFYLLSLLFFAPSVLIFEFARENALWISISILLPIVSVFYGLLLGRLSWIIDDEIRSASYDN